MRIESNSRDSANSRRLYILDPLRFAAAMLVMGYHYSAYLVSLDLVSVSTFLQYGYLGVNFFFMLSGFVIMASCKNRSAWRFAILRGVRIYPAFVACLLITVSSLYFFGNGIPTFKSIFFNALIINDYLRLPNVDGVYWTLQAELKFYGCIFLLILSSAITKPKIWVSLWFLAAVLFHFTKQPFFLGWLISPSYSFYFMGGVCAYGLYQNRRDVFFIFMFLLAGIFSSIKATEQISGFVPNIDAQDNWVAVSVVFFMYVFYWLLANNLLNLKARPSWALLGGISYPIYLIHAVAGKTLVDFLIIRIGLIASLSITIFLMFCICVSIHVFIEKPIFKAIRYKFNI